MQACKQDLSDNILASFYIKNKTIASRKTQFLTYHPDFKAMNQ